MKTGQAGKFVFSLIVLMVFSFVMATSCRNSMEDVNAVPGKDTAPVEMGVNIEIIYSDSAQVEAVVKSPFYKRYEGKDPYIVLPMGINVVFYDSLMRVKTTLTAGYAIKYDRKNVMEVKKNVVVINQAGERLDTEHLIWSEKERRIYTNVNVKVTQSDRIVFGRGLNADDSFDKWNIPDPSGIFYFNTGDEEVEE